MQINLSEHAAALARHQAAAFGYGDDVSAYLSHLISTNQPNAEHGVPSPKTRDELVQLLQEGLDSGTAERSWEEMMSQLKNDLATRMNSPES